MKSSLVLLLLPWLAAALPTERSGARSDSEAVDGMGLSRLYPGRLESEEGCSGPNQTPEVSFAHKAPNTDPAFVAQIATATTQLQRNKLLSDDDFVFDFRPPQGGVPSGNGQAISANAATMPSLYKENLAVTLAFVAPCGMNSPHIHPRASELAYVIEGAFMTGMFQENGAQLIQNNVTAGQAVLFPRGSVHYQANLECSPASFVAALGGEDPGTLQIAQGFFGLPESIVGATLGGLSDAQVMALKTVIPPNLVAGLDECVKRCGLRVVDGRVVQGN